MSADWIKIRVCLPDEPEVIGIASRCGIAEDEVVGKLVRLWSWADQHLRSCNAPSVTTLWVNHYLRQDGFAEALIDVGWLESTDSGLVFPGIEKHNLQPAKERALTNKRVAEHRKVAKRKCNGGSVTKSLPQEQKNKEKGASERPASFDPSAVEIPSSLNTPQFTAAWSDWCQHRQEIKKPLTPTAVSQQLKKLERWGEHRAIEALTHTTAQGWQGIREPDGKDDAVGNRPPTTQELREGYRP